MQYVELFNYIVKKNDLPFKISRIRIPKETIHLLEVANNELSGMEFDLDIPAERKLDGEEADFVIQIKKE